MKVTNIPCQTWSCLFLAAKLQPVNWDPCWPIVASTFHSMYFKKKLPPHSSLPSISSHNFSAHTQVAFEGHLAWRKSVCSGLVDHRITKRCRFQSHICHTSLPDFLNNLRHNVPHLAVQTNYGGCFCHSIYLTWLMLCSTWLICIPLRLVNSLASRSSKTSG